MELHTKRLSLKPATDKDADTRIGMEKSKEEIIDGKPLTFYRIENRI